MLAFLWRRKRYYRYTRSVAGAIQRRLAGLVAMLALCFILHVSAMMAFEDLGLAEAAWLTITTATTVGYGDLSASTALGRMSTTVCLYLFGIYLLAQAASDLFDYRTLSRDRRRRGEHCWRNMKDHLLIVNVPSDDTDRYLNLLVRHVRATPSLHDIPVHILTDRFPDGLPSALLQRGVTHFSGVAENSENLAAANASFAQYVLVIANDFGTPRCDAFTFDIVHRIQRLCAEADRALPTIVAEAVDDGNRSRLLAAGATAVVRPVRAYPEFVVKALAEPGTEKVIENFFTHDSDRLIRFEVPFQNLKWGQVIVQLVQSGAGVPLAYVRDGIVDTNPRPSAICSGDGIIVLLDETQHGTVASIKSCIDILQERRAAES